MSRVAAPALLALLVVVAGCSALPGDGGGPPGTTLSPGERQAATEAWPGPPTVAVPAGATAVEVDGGTPVPARVVAAYPPGVAPDGVYDRAALVGAHAGRLGRTSYTLTWTATARGPDGTLRTSLTSRVRADGPADRRVARVTATDRNGSATWTAVRTDGRTDARNRSEGRPDPPATTLAAEDALGEDTARRGDVAALFRGFAVDRVERRQQVDGPHYLLLADRVVAPDALADAPDARVTNASFVALVDASGVVRWLRVEYDVVRDGTRTHRRVEMRVSLVGSTRVPQPDWGGPSDEGAGEGEESTASEAETTAAAEVERRTGATVPRG